MAKVRRVIQKIERHEPRGFEDQLWPTNVALLVLAGFVAVLIVVEGDFDDPRLLHNGWFRLVALLITVGGLFWVALRAGRRIARRTQFAILLSLIVHIALALLLKDRYLQIMAERQETERRQPVEEEEPVTINRYVVRPLDEPRPQQAFEKPVETPTPTPRPNQQPQERETPRPREVEPQKQPVAAPAPTPTPRPNPVPLERRQPAAPRRAEQTSKLSRQVEPARRAPQAAVTAPRAPPQVEPRPAKPLEAANAEAARAQNSFQVAKQAASEKPTTVERRRRVQMAARAERQAATPENAATPTLERQVAQAARVPRADARRPEVARPSQPAQGEAPAPSAQVVERTRAAEPQAAKQSIEPTPERSMQVARADAARRANEARPTLAQTEQAAPSKQRGETELTPGQVAAPQSELAAQPAEQAAPGPRAAQVARSATPAPRAANPRAALADAPRAQALGRVARMDAPRAKTADAPSLRPTDQPSDRPRKSVAQGAEAASPARVDRPALARSATQDRPLAEPSSSSLSKARSGFVGRGRSDNADVATAANPRHAAPVASAAARRQKVTTAEAGESLAPSRPARVAKARAGAETPAALRRAQGLAAPEVAGAQRPTRLAQAASAAVERRDAAAPVAETSAAVGNVELDTGPMRIVPERGDGRASGGGQPKIAVNAQRQEPERTRAGGATLAGVVAEALAPAPVAPVAEGGGAPSGPAGPQVAELTQKRSGGPPAGAAPQMPEPAAGSAGRAGDVAASPISRAAATDARPDATPGGAGSPAAEKGREVAMLPRGEVPQLEVPARGGGAPQDATPDAAGDLGELAGGGLPGKAVSGPVGALAGPVAVDAPEVGEVGVGMALAKAGVGSREAPSIGEVGEGAPLRKAATAKLPAGMLAEADPLPLAAMPAGEAVDADTPSGSHLPTDLATDLPGRASSGLPVQVIARAGPGGLGPRLTADVGLPSRRARRETQIVHNVPERFPQKKVGGLASVSGRARQIAEPFARRGKRLEEMAGEGGPSAKTEAAIELGLVFLARHQSPDGSWSFNDFSQGRPGYENERAAIHADSAATGLALLSFLGAGYDHFDDKYKDRVAAGLNYLIQNQRPDGNLYVPQDQYTNQVAQLYGHGIASIALCEAYGMTGDPALGKAAQKAIDFIVASQHPQRGGWRYTPGYMSDLSVSGWQLMALRSGELAGLEVPRETYERVKRFIDRCQASPDDGSLYVYNPYAANTPAQRHGRLPSTVMTSVGLLMRLYTGWDRDHAELRRGADHLLANLPQIGGRGETAPIGTIKNPLRDTYYWYYATQVMFHMRGKYWRAWNGALHPLLTESQIQDGTFAGSWDPRLPVPDRWGPHGGRIYVTTMNLLSLEVYYRHLPIYADTAK